MTVSEASTPRGGSLSRWLKRLAALLFVLFAALVALYLVVDEPVPEGELGADAGALAASIERAVNVEAFERTGAVEWGFAGNRHLWDRQREVARVQMGDEVALLRVGGPEGRAYRAGREVRGDDARSILEAAHAAFVNDAFWLNPLAKLRDPGVELRSVRLEGERALLVTYTSGGLTPGDSYLWLVDDSGRPRAWRLWVSIIPVGGVETSWEGWQELSTGALIATRHETSVGVTVELRDVRGADSLETLLEGDEDPFAPLFE